MFRHAGNVSFSAYLVSDTSKTTYILPCTMSAGTSYLDWMAYGHLLAKRQTEELSSQRDAWALGHIRISIDISRPEIPQPPFPGGEVLFYGRTLEQGGGCSESGSFDHDKLHPQSDAEAMAAGLAVLAAKNARTTGQPYALLSVWKVVRINP